MISDLEIYPAAKLLVDRHGEGAAIRAAERADDLLEAGDIEGAAIWRAIMCAIDELQRGRLDGESELMTKRRADLRDLPDRLELLRPAGHFVTHALPDEPTSPLISE